MRPMRSFGTLLIALAGALATCVTGVAQSPSPAVGTDVPYADAAAGQAGTVTVRGIEDPFTAYREDSPPADGQRYVLLSVAFEAAEDMPFEASASRILLQDTDGFLWAAADVPRPSDATPKELQSQD